MGEKIHSYGTQHTQFKNALGVVCISGYGRDSRRIGRYYLICLDVAWIRFTLPMRFDVPIGFGNKSSSRVAQQNVVMPF